MGGRKVGTIAPDLLDVAEQQQENHLCENACTNGIDDDDDIDIDAECNPALWP
jgi:hypothetical protein